MFIAEQGSDIPQTQWSQFLAGELAPFRLTSSKPTKFLPPAGCAGGTEDDRCKISDDLRHHRSVDLRGYHGMRFHEFSNFQFFSLCAGAPPRIAELNLAKKFYRNLPNSAAGGPGICVYTGVRGKQRKR